MGKCSTNISFDPARVLVVLPSWVGDVVMATPTLRSLRARFASAEMIAVCRPAFRQLLSQAPWFDDVVRWEPKRGGDRTARFRAAASALRAKRIDLALLLPNSFRSAALACWARCKRRVGYARDGRRWLLTDALTAPKEHGAWAIRPMVEYYGALAEYVGCDPPGDRLELFTDETSDTAVAQRLGPWCESDAPLVVISPGASFGASKMWLPERFAALADRLVEAHGALVVLSCAPGEEAIVRTIAAQMKRNSLVLDNPATNLGEFKSLIRRSDLVINNDAGARHVAKAFGVPVVTVFGPTHQGWTVTDYPLERSIAIPVDCGPCQKKLCPLDHRCMTGVSVDMVAQACDELLAARKPFSACAGETA